MSCEILSVDGAVFVLWGKPTKADLDRVVQQVELAASKSGGPIVFVARIPQGAPAPEGEARAHMNALTPHFAKFCFSYHAILEGSGFVSAVKRAILAGLLQFDFRKGAFAVHDSEKSIAGKVERSMRPRVEALLSLASAKGLLTAASPEDYAQASLKTRG